MIKSRSPKRLWDDCLELELYTGLKYKLDGDVPEMIMSGETSHTSQFSDVVPMGDVSRLNGSISRWSF